MAAQRTLPVKQITLNMALAVDSISFDAVRVALDLVANMQRLEMTVRFFIQRLEQSGISEQRRQPVSESKCQINDNKIEPCAALTQSLEHDAEYTTRKGLLKYKIYNHALIHSQDLIMLRSGEFSKSPIRVSFCPFCGESLKTWEAEATSEQD